MFPLITIFSEGTTSNNTTVLPFKKGAFLAGKPVSLMSISWDNRFRDPSDASASLLHAALPGFLGLYTKIRVQYLGDYHPNAEEAADPVLYAANARKFFAQQVKKPMVDYTFKDKTYFMGRHSDFSRCTLKY